MNCSLLLIILLTSPPTAYYRGSFYFCRAEQQDHSRTKVTATASVSSLSSLSSSSSTTTDDGGYNTVSSSFYNQNVFEFSREATTIEVLVAATAAAEEEEEENTEKEHQENQGEQDKMRMVDAAKRVIHASLLVTSTVPSSSSLLSSDVRMAVSPSSDFNSSSADLLYQLNTNNHNQLKQQHMQQQMQQQVIVDDLILIFGTMFDREEIVSMIRNEIIVVAAEIASVSGGNSDGDGNSDGNSDDSNKGGGNNDHDVESYKDCVCDDNNTDRNNSNNNNNNDHTTTQSTSTSTSTSTHSTQSTTQSTSQRAMTDKFSGDRHAQGILDTVDDYDCLEREFDMKELEVEHKHNVKQAMIQVFQKCRIIVIRNVFSRHTIETILPKYIQYITDIDNGAISSQGTTTMGGDYFILKEDQNRYNFMITKELIAQSSNLLAHPTIIDLLSHPTILGDDMILNHAGTITAQPSSPLSHHRAGRQQTQQQQQQQQPQYWHIDGEYIPNPNNNDHDWQSFEETGIGGHDLRPYAINMFTPLNINMTSTPESGPTEFCMGTSHLRGHDMETDFPVSDSTLLTKKKGIIESLQEFEWYVENGHARDERNTCPSQLVRIPLLNIGDVVLFDYMVTHRGGANNSHTIRSLLFAMYSRKWYRDTTFDTLQQQQENGNNGYDNEKEETELELEHLIKLTRFAVIEKEEEMETNL